MAETPSEQPPPLLDKPAGETILARLYHATVLLSVLGAVFLIFTLVFKPLPFSFFSETRNTVVHNVLPLGLDPPLGLSIRPDFNRRVSESYQINSWLPVIDPETGQSPLDTYRNPDIAAVSGRQKAVVIILHGLGLSQSLSVAAIQRLHPDITLAFKAYTTNLQDWLFDLRQKGSEIILELPLTSASGAIHQGPLDISAHQLRQNDLSRLYGVLSKATGYVGVLMPAGSEIDAGGQSRNVLLAELRKRGLGIVDFSGQLPTEPDDGQPALYYARPDITLPFAANPETISRTINRIKTSVAGGRTLVVAAGASRLVLEALPPLTDWLEDENIRILPLSAHLLRN